MKKKNKEEKFKERLLEQIKYIVSFFVDNFIDNRKICGWGYANGCSEPSLFFTYSVIEAYSDLEDNIYGLGDDVRDETLIEYLKVGDRNLLKELHDLCFKVGDVTWEIYKKNLRNSFFSEKFDGTVNIITNEAIRNSSRSTALFNSLYITFILFYTYMNNPEIHAHRYDIPGNVVRGQEEIDDVINSMTRCLQNIQNFYSDLKEEGLESIVNKHTISFNQLNTISPEISRVLNNEEVQASSLLPMLVKGYNLVNLYILKFPQQDMSDLFDEILDAKMENEWLWEERKYSLLSTERYIEAIADFFDYYDEYERSYAKRNYDRQEEVEKIRKRIQASTDRRIKDREEQLEKASEEALAKAKEELLRQNEEELRKERERINFEISSRYTIEPRIEDKINDILDQRLGGMFNEKLAKALETITSLNNSYYKSEKVELSEEQQLIKDAFTNYEKSKIAALVGESLSYAYALEEQYNLECTREQFEELIRNDLMKFFDRYIYYIGTKSENGSSSKFSLTSIFKDK